MISPFDTTFYLFLILSLLFIAFAIISFVSKKHTNKERLNCCILAFLCLLATAKTYDVNIKENKLPTDTSKYMFIKASYHINGKDTVTIKCDTTFQSDK